MSKKQFAKLLALFLTTVMLISSFASCGSFKKEDFMDTDNQIDSEVSVYTGKKAENVEKNIVYAEPTDDGTILKVTDKSPLASLEEGDVFILEGDSDSTFGELYFGKIEYASENNGEFTYEIVTPTIDEVFESIDFDMDSKMTSDNITSFTAVEGVNIKSAEEAGLCNPYQYDKLSSDEKSEYELSPLDSKDGVSVTLGKKDIVLELNVDILKLLENAGVISKTSSQAKRITSADEANDTTVFYTDTGLCYHRSNCHCLAKSKYDISLKDAVFEEELKACRICNAPILIYDDWGEKISSSAELKLTGSVALHDLSFAIKGKNGKDWTAKQGFDNLSLQTNGDFVAKTEITGNFKATLSGTSSRLILWGDEKNPKIYFDGLNEKLLPIAFITWDGGRFSARVGAASDEVDMPFTVGLMIYSDIYGNITASTEFFCEYNRSLDYKFDVFKNGDFVAVKDNGLSNSENTSSFDWYFKAEASAEVDFEALGASLMLYIGNMNVLDFCLARTGMEIDGKLNVDTTEWEQGSSGIEAKLDLCLYLEMFDLDFKIKYKSWDDALEVNPDPLVRIELLSDKMQVGDIPTSTDQQLEFELDNGGECYSVIGIGTCTGDIVVPSSYNGKPVKNIQVSAFENCETIKTVTIEDGITSIMAYAFSGCKNLEKIEIPSSVTYISQGVFSECDNLGTVNIPDSITRIEEYTFSNCKNMISVILPNGIAEVNIGAFDGCIALATVYYDGSQSEWNEIVINQSYNQALNDAELVFLRDDVIEDESGEKNTEEFSSEEEITTDHEETTTEREETTSEEESTSIEDTTPTTSSKGLQFSLNEDGLGYTVVDIGTCEDTDIVIDTYNGLPITSIGDRAFYYCDSLTSVVIGDSVTSIGDGAFYHCDSLTSVEIPDSVTSIGSYAFEYCDSLTSVVIGDSVESIGNSAFYGCDSLTSVVIGDSVTSIGDGAFYYCDSLTSVVIGDSVTSIGSSAFYNTAYYNNESNWENGVLYIGKYLIKAKTSISGAYTVKDGTKLIADSAFYYCDSLTSVEIGDSVTSIGDSAFYECDNLTSVKIGDSVTSIGSCAFRYCSSLTSIEIPDSVESIGSAAFANCDSLTSVEIPDSVTSIDDNAFFGCHKLVEVINKSDFNIRAGSLSYGYIGYYAKEVHSGESKIVNKDGYLFYTYDGTNYLLGYVGAKNATTLTLPDNYNGESYEIYGSAFFGCDSLTSVVIGDSVTSIGNYAFSDCDSLTSVYYKGTANEWSDISIGSYNNSDLTDANRYYYSENEPTEDGYWWHYVDGVPTAW